MTYQPAPEGRDPQLWHLAQKRTSIKKHVATYLIVNSFLWALWFLGGNNGGARIAGNHIPWPVWPMLGWGIGLVFHYIGAYVTKGGSSVENEYQKLKNQSNKN